MGRKQPKMTDEERKFLAALQPEGKPTPVLSLPLATREQDRARTSAKRFGWARFDRKLWAWLLTEEGIAALSAPPYER